MPIVNIYAPSPKTDISPIMRKSFTQDIEEVDGVTNVVPGGTGPTYTADVTCPPNVTPNIAPALRPSVPSDWTLSVA